MIQQNDAKFALNIVKYAVKLILISAQSAMILTLQMLKVYVNALE